MLTVILAVKCCAVVLAGIYAVGEKGCKPKLKRSCGLLQRLS